MAIVVTCPCGQRLRAKDAAAGRKGVCPACGKTLIIGDARTPAEARTVPPSRPLRRHTCAECEASFDAADLVNVQGRLVCPKCLEAGTSPGPASGAAKTVLVLAGVGGALFVGIVAIALNFALKGDRASASPETSTTAAMESPAEEPAPQRRPSIRRAPSARPTPTEAPDEPDAVPAPGRVGGRSSEALRSAFMASLVDWDDLYWDYRPAEADEALARKVLTDPRLVGDGSHRDVRHPPASFAGGWGLSAVNLPTAEDRTVNLGLYTAGEGLDRDALVAELGEPRFEERIGEATYLAYGRVSVLYDAKGTFLGVVDFQRMNADEAGDDDGPAGAIAAGAASDPPDATGDEGAMPENALALRTDEEPVAPSLAEPPEPAAEPDAGEPVTAPGTAWPLEYRPIPEPDHPMAAIATQYVSGSPQRPDDLKSLPRGMAAPMFFVVPVGGERIVMALEPTGRPRLYVDTDFNGDLASEKAFAGAVIPSARRGRGPEFRFGPIELTSDPARHATPVRIAVETYAERFLKIRPAGCFMGKIRVRGESRTFAVIDGNLDGRCDGVSSLGRSQRARGRSDAIGVDHSGNGRFEVPPFGRVEVHPLTKMIGIDKAYYELQVEPDGSAVRLSEVKPAFGTLDVGNPSVDLMLFSDTGVHHLTGSQGKWRLPVGPYTCWAVALRRGDRRTGYYRLVSNGKTGELQNIEIHSDRPVSLKIGAPLVLASSVQKRESRTRGRTVSIGVTVADGAGVQYNVAAELNGKALPPPTLRILNQAGKVLEVGKFEYG